MSATSTRDTLKQQVVELQAVNKELINRNFGRRSECRPDSPDQMQLDFGDSEESPSEEEQNVITAQEEADAALDERIQRDAHARRRQRRERQQQESREFPASNERRERLLDLSDDAKQGLKHIGDAVFERLRFEKPSVYVERIVRRKYVKRNEPDRGVVAMPAPVGMIEGCRYDFSVIAATVGQKFAFHSPTYRQQDWFAQSGWFPSRSTINYLINLATHAVAPLFAQIWALLMRHLRQSV